MTLPSVCDTGKEGNILAVSSQVSHGREADIQYLISGDSKGFQVIEGQVYDPAISSSLRPLMWEAEGSAGSQS